MKPLSVTDLPVQQEIWLR